MPCPQVTSQLIITKATRTLARDAPRSMFDECTCHAMPCALRITEGCVAAGLEEGTTEKDFKDAVAGLLPRLVSACSFQNDHQVAPSEVRRGAALFVAVSARFTLRDRCGQLLAVTPTRAISSQWWQWMLLQCMWTDVSNLCCMASAAKNACCTAKWMDTS
jgi:hypothetical protein